LQAAVDFLGDEGSGLGYQVLSVEPKPLLGIELASLSPSLLLLQHHFWHIAVACVVEVDVGRIHVEISQAALTKLAHLLFNRIIIQEFIEITVVQDTLCF
jgi:hypothetical protein